MFVAAITGSIGSGKSEVAHNLASLGAKVIDADKLARQVVEKGKPGLSAVIKRFGPEFLDSDGGLNRSKLGDLIFRDPNSRRELENLLHPLIREEFLRQLRDLEKVSKQQDILIYVVPLLFESKNVYPEVKLKILVSAHKEKCIERIIKRDNCSVQTAENKYNSQMPDEKKRELADYIIENNSTAEELKLQSEKLFNELQRLALELF